MTRGELLYHKDKRIVHFDLSNATLDDIERAISEGSAHVYSQPHKSVLCWVNTEGTRITKEVSDTLKNFTLKNKPYIKMTAISGISGIQKVVLSAIIIFTKRDNLVVKNSMEEALDFLAAVEEPAVGVN